MQPIEEVGFFDGDIGDIEAKLRQSLNERNNTEDKLARQILTLQIRELRDKLLSSGSVQSDEKYTLPSETEFVSLFDGDLGRVESQLRDAMKRKSQCQVLAHRESLQREVDALVELLKSPVVHSSSGQFVDHRKLWNLIRSQNITALQSVDAILLRTLRDPDTGHSVLHRAALLNNPALIDLLASSKKCDVDSICHRGQTPLHIAVQVENVDAAKRLVSLGANVEIVDNKGRTAFSGVPKFLLNQFIDSQTPGDLDDEDWELDPSSIQYGETIGEGATATVYSGHCKSQPVAIKNISSIQRSEFNREVRILMRLHHPSLVEFVGATTKDQLRLVMKLCRGGSLHELLHDKRQALSMSQVMQLCRGALAGLEYLHTQDPQIIHMDLKSRNLLLFEPVMSDKSEVCVKIADFGISRIATTTSNNRIAGQLPVLAGTWFWMSPEALVGDLDEISAKCDIYSFSICVFEMLSGELPFASVDGLELLPPVTIAIKVANGFRPDIQRIRDKRDATDPRVTKLVGLMEKCWSYEPTDRLSANDFIQALP